MTVKKRNTKDALVSAAHRLFAEQGFEGVSIADIAGELDITKQALLHHFGSKEKLYGTVLEELSVRFDSIVQEHLTQHASPSEQYRSILRDLYRHMNRDKHDAQLIMRELLDNRPRAKGKRKWYLRGFLETLSELTQTLSGQGGLSKAEAFARTFQMMGAVNYFAISDPTLKTMFGEATYNDIENVFLDQLEQLFLQR
ncbi:MAG: TetR/AcrR family transcriptional regulator [Pseudomonadota bacterium]